MRNQKNIKVDAETYQKLRAMAYHEKIRMNAVVKQALENIWPEAQKKYNIVLDNGSEVA